MSEYENLIAQAADAPAFFSKESKPGDSVIIRITAIDYRQTRDVKTRKPEFWDDGTTPKQQFVIVGDVPDSEDAHTIYVKWWGAARKAFAAAILDSGASAPEVGGLLKVTYDGEEEGKPKPGLSKAKLYSYSYNGDNVPF